MCTWRLLVFCTQSHRGAFYSLLVLWVAEIGCCMSLFQLAIILALLAFPHAIVAGVFQPALVVQYDVVATYFSHLDCEQVFLSLREHLPLPTSGQPCRAQANYDRCATFTHCISCSLADPASLDHWTLNSMKSPMEQVRQSKGHSSYP